jgi:hypothetical protein
MADEIRARPELLKSAPEPSDEEWRAATPRETLDLPASLQATVIEELLRRAVRSAEEIGALSDCRRWRGLQSGAACNDLPLFYAGLDRPRMLRPASRSQI